jgi:hypothetical protein
MIRISALHQYYRAADNVRLIAGLHGWLPSQVHDKSIPGALQVLATLSAGPYGYIRPVQIRAWITVTFSSERIGRVLRPQLHARMSVAVCKIQA